MIKWFGAGLLFLCGTMLGRQYSEQTIAQERIYAEMLAFLQALHSAFHYRRIATFNALKAAANVQQFHFLQIDAFEQDSLLPALEEFERKTKQATPLFRQQISDMFFITVRTLGRETAEEEEQKLRYAIQQLETAHQNAKTNAATQCKLYRTLGMAGGAAVALLLL